MRKDNINVFSEGLNYDLNPLTTPNNVLTDCVNGTFITFNGDELALQADAGNTKIPYEFTNTEIAAMWTLDQAEVVDPSFNWINLEVEHNTITSFSTYIENTFQFLYISVPQNTIISIFNQIDMLLYDSTLPDSDENQLFYLIGTMVTSRGTTNNVYRKKDQFNTNNPVVFKLKVFIENIDEIPAIEKNVELSTGFLPLGMKEEGGVLYIISGKKPVDNVEKWVPGRTYVLGNRVYNDTLIKTYYESIYQTENHPEGAHSSPLPLETNKYWKVIGTFEDYNNYLGEIEIGSYPSPKFGGLTGIDGTQLNYVEIEGGERTINQELYNYRSINDEMFKTSRYIKFEGTSVGNILGTVDNTTLDDDGRFNISGYNKDVKVTKFYAIKLYHQLNNGYLDVTNDIWTKYRRFRGDDLGNSGDLRFFWFSDDGFYYYCPNQYKGKLAMSVEIEDIKDFKLDGIPTIKYIPNVIPEEDGTYQLDLNVIAEGNPTIVVDGITQETMTVKNIFVTTTISGESPIYSGARPVTANKASYTQSIPIEHQDKIIEYQIVPEFSYNNSVIGDNSVPGQYNTFLPQQYLNKYIIEGRRVISTEYDIKFKELTYECDLSTGKKTQTVVALTDTNGIYINMNLYPVNDPFFFEWDDPSVTPPTGTSMGTYTINDNGYPTVTTPITGAEYIAQMFASYKVRGYDELCAQTTLTIYFNEGMSLCDGTIIKVTQAGVQQTFTPETAPSFNAIEVVILPNYNVDVVITRPGFETIVDAFFPTTDVVRYYAFIANIKVLSEISAEQGKPTKHFLRWEGPPTTLPNLSSIQYSYYKTGESPNTVTLTLVKGLKQSTQYGEYCGYESNKVGMSNNTFVPEDSMRLLGYQEVTGTYQNINNNNLYGTLPATISNCPVGCTDGTNPASVGVIFKRELNPEDMGGSSQEGFYIYFTLYCTTIDSGPGNGMSGFLIANSQTFTIPSNYPVSSYFVLGPLVAGNYMVYADSLNACVNTQPVPTRMSYDINQTGITYDSSFEVSVNSNVSVYIYLEPNV